MEEQKKWAIVPIPFAMRVLSLAQKNLTTSAFLGIILRTPEAWLRQNVDPLEDTETSSKAQPDLRPTWLAGAKYSDLEDAFEKLAQGRAG